MENKKCENILENFPDFPSFYRLHKWFSKRGLELFKWFLFFMYIDSTSSHVHCCYFKGPLNSYIKENKMCE